MATPVYDLGPILGIEAEALGVPGQRTFRIHAHSRSGAARLWLEKEQLQALAAAIEQLLTEVGQVRGFSKGADSPLLPFSGEPGVEFHVGRITLGYEQIPDRISMAVFEASDDDEAEEDDEPELEADLDRAQVQLLATRDQMHAFGRQAQETCAAGRPRCPLCGTPLDGPTHFCPRSNGHASLPGEEH